MQCFREYITKRDDLIVVKKNSQWRATTKARGNCSPQCSGKIFVGHGATLRAAKADAEAKCRASECHTPGGKPYSCNCGHSIAYLISG
jgi:hypothetical protein